MESVLYKVLVLLADTGIYGLIALGLGVAFRVARFPDLTAEGSFVLGAVAAYLAAVAALPFPLMMVLGAAAGIAAGSVTAALHTWLKVPGILSGILTWMALYSINLRLLGSPNMRMNTARILVPPGDEYGLLDAAAAVALPVGVVCVIAVGVLWCLLESRAGLRLRCSAANPYMASSLGLRTKRYTFFGLAMANGLVGLAGGLFAAKAGYVDVNMGAGILVAGIAPLFLGGAFITGVSTPALVAACVVGGLFYRGVIAMALEAGLDPRDLRLLTTVLVLFGLALSRLRGRPAVELSLDSMIGK